MSHERLAAQPYGFGGHYQRVKIYVASSGRRSWPSSATTMPPSIVGSTRRFSVTPSAQAQVDWGDEGTITTPAVELSVYSFHMVSYSREPLYRYTTSMDLATFWARHRAAFVYDRTKTFVRRHVARDEATPLHPEAVAFADHYGFAIRLCEPYWAKPTTTDRAVDYHAPVRPSARYGMSQVQSEIASARRSQLKLLAAVELHITAGQTADTLTKLAARQRMALAQGLLEVGDDLLRIGNTPNRQVHLRSAIGRYYYAMYQAARSVVFIDFGGDDKNGHQDVVKHLPADFPQRDLWLNELKNARVIRNDADYDPYPTGADEWQSQAIDLQAVAKDFVDKAEGYLSNRGA